MVWHGLLFSVQERLTQVLIGNVEGDLFSLNLGTNFNSESANFTNLFNISQKAGGAANNIAPNYVDGTMFTNDNEFYLYGGLLRLTDSQTDPDEDSVLGYEAFQYGPSRQSWSPGFYQGKLPDGVTRFVTNGAGVSIHSENLGYYFSGQRAPGWGPIHGGIPSANLSANTLISYDMTDMRSNKWANETLPGNITARANAELVWIPTGPRGILVAIGGVVDPEEIFVGAGLNDTQTKQSKDTSPSLMTQLAVYDIASGTWYQQNTTGDKPPQLTEFCSVVARAQDSSSFNVYVYGGYDGLSSTDNPSDDVWILSLPSFTWIKAVSGNGSHGRRAHKCHAVYPDQMFVIGGQNLDTTSCLEGGMIEVFNLNTLRFQDSYDPATWEAYKVPSVVTAVIGGDVNGGASKKFPTDSGGNEALANLFGVSYTKTIQNYYPYKKTAPSSSATPTGITKTEKGGSSGLPSWAGAVLGVLLGLIALSIIVVIILIIRKRRRNARRSSYSTSVTGSNNRIMRWVNGMPNTTQDHKTMSEPDTVTDDSTVASPLSHPSTAGNSGYFEAGGIQRFELQDVSTVRGPIEMPTPFNFEVLNSHNGHSSAGDHSTDFAYSNGNPSDRHRGQSQSEVSMPTSTGVGVESTSSPPLHPHSPDHVGTSPLIQSQHGRGSSPSPMSVSRAASPEDGDVNASANPSRTGNHSPAPNSPNRPRHERNLSSMSSGVNALQTPRDETSPEEEHRRSLVLDDLPEGHEEGRTRSGSGNESLGGSGDGGEVKRKKSSFREGVV